MKNIMKSFDWFPMMVGVGDDGGTQTYTSY